MARQGRWYGSIEQRDDGDLRVWVAFPVLQFAVVLAFSAVLGYLLASCH